MTPNAQREARPKPCVIVPAYNHAEGLTLVLGALDALGLAVIVVDDASTDRTPDVIRAWAGTRPDASAPRLALRHQRNLGKAGALRTGFEHASTLGFTHAVTIDADAQLDPADIPRLVDASKLDPDALVLGVRPTDMQGCPARCATGRRYAGLAIRAQTGRRLADTQCGLRLYPLALLDRVHCRAGQYAFEAEVITRAIWEGTPVVEVPVSCVYHPPGERTSHFRPWADSLRQAGTHLRLIARALLPGGRRREALDDPPVRTLRRAAAWLNPTRCVHDLRSSELGVLELSAGAGIGAFIGTLPFFGCHTPLGLYVAWRLHLHPAPVVLGTQVSIPPFGIALGVASIGVGRLMLTPLLGVPHWPEFAWSSLPELSLGVAGAWLLGSLFVGAAMCGAVFLTLRASLPIRDLADEALSIEAFAKREGVSRAQIQKLLPLTTLGPEALRAALTGRCLQDPSLDAQLSAARSLSWRAQAMCVPVG